MTHWIFKALMVVALGASLEAATNSEKIYISDQNVSIEGKQILVQCGNEAIPIARLASDEHGLYLYKNDLPLGFWVCQNGHVNHPWHFVCAICGSPY